MNKLLKEKWTVIDGCIYTDKLHEKELPSGKKLVRECIAFNVGDAAHHIVKLHNATLEKTHEKASFSS